MSGIIRPVQARSYSGLRWSVVDHFLLPVRVSLDVLETFGQLVDLAFDRCDAIHDLVIGASQEFFQVLQLLGVDLWFLLFAQVLHAAFECQASLPGLVLLQGVLAEVVEELDVQQDQDCLLYTSPSPRD